MANNVRSWSVDEVLDNVRAKFGEEGVAGIQGKRCKLDPTATISLGL